MDTVTKCRVEGDCIGMPWCRFTGCVRKAQAHNKLANQQRRTERARNHEGVTCPASRHVHMIADALAKGGGERKILYAMLTEEPQHCAGSLYSVLESLWKARAEIARLTKQLKREGVSE